VTQRISRRAFIRALRQHRKFPIRPPWAGGEIAFAAACAPNCGGACVKACPESILVSAADSRPEVRFELGECTFCGDCADVCPSGALVKHDASGRLLAPWSLKAEIANSCLAVSGVTCRACSEACGEDAVNFRLGLNGAAYPAVSDDACTGCGACVKPCPVDAVALEDRTSILEGVA